MIAYLIHSPNHRGQERHTGSVIPGQLSHIIVYLSIYNPSLLYNSSCFNPFEASYALWAASIVLTKLIFKPVRALLFIIQRTIAAGLQQYAVIHLKTLQGK